MGALHVVGEDLELRLGVHPRGVAQQQVAVGLLGVGLLRLGLDEHLAVEHRARAAVQNALVDLPAPAVGLVVVDGGVVVDHLLAAGEVEPVHQGLDVLVVEPDVQVVPGQRAAHRQRERAVVAVALLVHVGEPDVVGALALALDPGVLDPGARRRPPPR